MGRRRGSIRPQLQIVGQTPEGLQIVRGAFEFFDTYGVPLDVVFDNLRRAGYLPDWVHLYDRCLEAGWNPTSTWERLRILVGDVYGPVFREQWEKTMQKHLEGKE